MKKKRNNCEISALCLGCKYSTIASGKEFICNRPDMGVTAVAAAIVDSFFGDCCKGYEATAAEPQKCP